jgi:hypothetical protein
MANEWTLFIRARGEIATDSGDGLTFNLTGKDAQAAPVPVVYIDGTAQPTDSGYTFNVGSQSVICSITFAISQAGKVITADYRWEYDLAADEGAAVFEVDKDVNIKKSKDVNGKDLIAISYSPTGNFRGVVVFEYMSDAFAAMFRNIIEKAYLFDIERASDATSPRTLSNLQATTYPKFAEIQGVPNLTHCGCEFMQVNT